MNIKDWSIKAYGIEPIRKIADIICYEAGDVLRDTIRLEDYPDCKGLYTKNLVVSLGDVLAMAQLLCNMMGIEFEDIKQQGLDRAIDRCKEKLEGKDGF